MSHYESCQFLRKDHLYFLRSQSERYSLPPFTIYYAFLNHYVSYVSMKSLWCLSFLLPHVGYYTCVEVIFTLRRQVGFYMMGVYAPTLLIVVLSWLSFWINPDASAARVPLGKTNFTNYNIFHFYLQGHKHCKHPSCSFS